MRNRLSQYWETVKAACYRPRHRRAVGGWLTVTNVASFSLVVLGIAMVVTLYATGPESIVQASPGGAVVTGPQDVVQAPAAPEITARVLPVPPAMPGMAQLALAEGVTVPPPARHHRASRPVVAATVVTHPAPAQSSSSAPPPAPAQSATTQAPPPVPTPTQSSSSAPPPTSTPSQAGSSLGAELLAKAETQAGVPYVYGGDTPSGFDCSGLIYWAAQQIGLTGMPRDTYEMLGQGVSSGVLVPVTSPEPGDLAFFGTGHVELYVSSGRFFGAQQPGTVVGFHDYGTGYVPTAYYRAA